MENKKLSLNYVVNMLPKSLIYKNVVYKLTVVDNGVYTKLIYKNSNLDKLVIEGVEFFTNEETVYSAYVMLEKIHKCINFLTMLREPLNENAIEPVDDLDSKLTLIETYLASQK